MKMKSPSDSEEFFIAADKGAKLDVKDKFEGETALHLASRNEHLEVVKLLIERGADINIKNNEGETPLDFAKKRPKRELV